MLSLNIQNTFSQLWPLYPRGCDLNIAGLQTYIYRSIKDAVWAEKNMSTISLHKGIPEGILEFHVSKFDIGLSWCAVWKELPNKWTRSGHFFNRIFWNKTFSTIRSSTRFIEERVASIAASNLSIASNMDQSFKGPLRFLLLLLAYG